jgi:hypothetical protein
MSAKRLPQNKVIKTNVVAACGEQGTTKGPITITWVRIRPPRMAEVPNDCLEQSWPARAKSLAACGGYRSEQVILRRPLRSLTEIDCPTARPELLLRILCSFTVYDGRFSGGRADS